MKDKKDYIGHKYGHLTIVKYVRYNPKSRASMWLTRCDCGNEREMELRSVKAGRIKTCGKCELKHKLKYQSKLKKVRTTKNIQTLYNRYVKKAQEQGYGWYISMEDFRTLVQKECTLCGAPASLRMRGSTQPINKLIRVSIKNDYTLENSGTCCVRCEEKYLKVGISKAIVEIIETYNFLKDNS